MQARKHNGPLEPIRKTDGNNGKNGSYSDRLLAKGQIWKTPIADFEILAMGKEFIHYKVTKRVGIRRVGAQVSGIEAMENYLRANRAQLASGSGKN